MAFTREDAEKKCMDLGGKQYLEVKWRMVWFREQCPQGTIDTEEVAVDLDREVAVELFRWEDDPAKPGKKRKVAYTKTAKGYARYRAIVTDGNGARATGTKSECAANFDDYIEKAETGAIGRALAALGYGTQFTGDELDEGKRIVDSPVPITNGQALHKLAAPGPYEQHHGEAPQPQSNGDEPQYPIEIIRLLSQFKELEPDWCKRNSNWDRALLTRVLELQKFEPFPVIFDEDDINRVELYVESVKQKKAKAGK